ncbi:MAG: hypothetical protein CMK07_11300 [Ponticaulis sp.]|nr:hypothetical protein [Ponticaulis sp.]
MKTLLRSAAAAFVLSSAQTFILPLHAAYAAEADDVVAASALASSIQDAIDDLPEDATETEIFVAAQSVLAESGEAAEIQQAAIDIVRNAALQAGDLVVVAALTNLVPVDATGGVPGQGNGIGPNGNAAGGNPPVSLPPSANAGGGSDY